MALEDPRHLEPRNPEALHAIHTLLPTTSTGQCQHNSAKIGGEAAERVI